MTELQIFQADFNVFSEGDPKLWFSINPET